MTTQMKDTERGAVYYAVQGGSNFESVDHILSVMTTEIRAIEQYFGNGVYCDVEGSSNF